MLVLAQNKIVKGKLQQQMQISQQEEISPSLQPRAKLPILTESKKQFEYIFKFLYLVASIFSAVLLHKVYLFQTMKQFDSHRQGTLMDILLYSLPFGTLFTMFDLGVHHVLDEPCERFYLTPDKYEGKARQRRSYTLVKWAYSIVYYAISSIIGIYLIKDTDYFPWWLGGHGTCYNQFMGAPALPQATSAMKIFYLFQLGKHASRLVSHMFIRQEGNYYEYVLHHSLSSFLILFSYLTNQWLVGIMVLICHDGSDLFLILGRAYKDYKHYSRKLLQVFYVLVMLSWIGGRLVVFPVCCVYYSLIRPDYVSEALSDVQANVLNLPYSWMGTMLLALLFLQLFWTYYIGKAFIEVNVSAKIAANTYE